MSEPTPLEKGKALSQIWSDGFMNLGRQYGEAWAKGVLRLDHLAILKGVLECMNTIYYEAVRIHYIDPIEKLDKDLKLELWEMSAGYEGMSKADRIRLSKAIWVLNALIPDQPKQKENEQS